MTPAQLTVLSQEHRRAHDPKARRSAVPEPGGVGDLLAFQAMRVAG